LTEHKIILLNDLSSLHFTRKCGDSKGVYRRHTLKDRRLKAPPPPQQQATGRSVFIVSY